MTRTEYAQYLRASATTKYGTNDAIVRHAQEVEAMTDAEFPAHMARLDAMTAAAEATIARLAKNLYRRRR